MFFKTFASPIALAAAAALALGSTAYAQTMVGDQEISDTDLPAVTEHCAMLSEAGAADSATTDDMATDDAAADDAVTADDSAAPDDNMAADGAVAEEGEMEIDLDIITLEECRAAGLAM